MHKFGDEPSHAQVRYGCSLLKIINLIVMDLERPWFLEFNQENICSRWYFLTLPKNNICSFENQC